MRIIAAISVVFFALSACVADTEKLPASALQTELEALQAQRADVPGFAVTVISGGREEQAATGKADPAGTPLTAETPVRMASITKTFVAAAILRLWEEGRIDLDAPIGTLLSADINALLVSDGYDTAQITVLHLLMHASGMAEHVGDAYITQVFADPGKIWTPAEQVEMLVETTDPLSAPGEAFAYSDTGYVLLGEILREATRLPLHEAVRQLLRLDELALLSLHWDEAEQPVASVPARAHQWNDGQDIFAFHGSMDGHGGGGIVASVTDVAKFYQALFGGDVFVKPATLDLMITAPGHPDGSPYRLGLFTAEVAGKVAYQHGGFWGTYVTHVLEMDLTVSGVALDSSGYRDLRKLMVQTIESRAEE